MRNPFGGPFGSSQETWLASRRFPPAFSEQVSFIRQRGGTVLATPSADRVAERLQGASTITALGQFQWSDSAWGANTALRLRRGRPSISWLVVGAQVLGAVTLSFTGRIVDETLAEVSTRAVVRPRDLTYPVLADRRYHEVQIEAWSTSGELTTGLGGWNFSSAQQAGPGGAYSQSFFSADDGAWAVRIGAGVDGDAPGDSVASGTQSYGITNYDSAEPVQGVWWAGTQYTGGYVICWT